MTLPKPHEIETFSGRFVDTKQPDPESIILEDIAHALSNICRYGGHCGRFYSVAEHSVFVSRRLERKGYGKAMCLAALHHDDAEAYLGDVPRPLKPLLGARYRELTDRMDAAIVQGLSMPFTPEAFHAEPVKQADNWALFVEAEHLLPSEGGEFLRVDDADQPERIVVPDYWLDGLSPVEAEGLFLSRHWELTE